MSRPRERWREDRLGLALRAGLRDTRRAAPSPAVWPRIAAHIGPAPRRPWSGLAAWLAAPDQRRGATWLVGWRLRSPAAALVLVVLLALALGPVVGTPLAGVPWDTNGSGARPRWASAGPDPDRTGAADAGPVGAAPAVAAVPNPGNDDAWLVEDPIAPDAGYWQIPQAPRPERPGGGLDGRPPAEAPLSWLGARIARWPGPAGTLGTVALGGTGYLRE